MYCGNCCTKCLHGPVFVDGDPRNIADIVKIVYDKHDQMHIILKKNISPSST